MKLSPWACIIGASTLITAGAGAALAADLDIDAYHGKFIDAFNGRQWQDVQALMAPDIVFHRGNATEVYAGADAVVGRFEETIGAPDQWNVKFVRLDSNGQLSGSDGGMVERGDFAITAGADDSGCYAGSYMMTWMPKDDDSWQLQLLSWQDLEADASNCK
jgi:ketosteroid isomerase-like protein